MDTVLGLTALSIATVAYFTPTLVAMARGKENTGAILLINVLTGWTVLGWLLAIGLAAGEKRNV